jgi:hypothetical protein
MLVLTLIGADEAKARNEFARTKSRWRTADLPREGLSNLFGSPGIIRTKHQGISGQFWKNCGEELLKDPCWPDPIKLFLYPRNQSPLRMSNVQWQPVICDGCARWLYIIVYGCVGIWSSCRSSESYFTLTPLDALTEFLDCNLDFPYIAGYRAERRQAF